tara:strand:+ start:343 stop:726 length:384 start_codon:yes stop_codon:yes gene_type:complete
MASILKVDTITGVATAGSIAITGEGNSTTTNLQQGLTKAFIIAESDATDIGSFNIASTTDNGTGDYTYTYTNNMNDNKAVVNGNCSQNNNAVVYNNGRNTTNYTVKLEEASSAVDRRVSSTSHGDLA